MTKSEKRTLWVVIGVSIAVGLLLNGLIFLSTPKDENLGARRSGGEQSDKGMDELVVFNSNRMKTSMSFNVTEDVVYIGDDLGGIMASPAVGDVVMFNTASAGFDDSVISEATKYYVTSVSYSDTGAATTSASDRFQISTTKGGTAVDFASTASSGGGEYFSVEIAESGEQDVSAFEHLLISLHTEEGTSGSFCFLASNMKEAPDWYEAKTTTNRYENIGVVDLESNTEIEGDACVRVDDTDTNELYFVTPAKGIRWLMPISENLASGDVDIRIFGY